MMRQSKILLRLKKQFGNAARRAKEATSGPIRVKPGVPRTKLQKSIEKAVVWAATRSYAEMDAVQKVLQVDNSSEIGADGEKVQDSADLYVSALYGMAVDKQTRRSYFTFSKLWEERGYSLDKSPTYGQVDRVI